MPLLPPANLLIPYLNALLIGLGVAVALLWFALALWAARDARARSRAWWVPVLVFLLVLLLPIIGLAVYLLLRPRQTLAGAYDQALEQEALLQQIEERPACPGCSRTVDPQWMVCPRCHTRLRQPCLACSMPLEMQWDICPYCATLVALPQETVETRLDNELAVDSDASANDVSPAMTVETGDADLAPAEQTTATSRRRRSKLG